MCGSTVLVSFVFTCVAVFDLLAAIYGNMIVIDYVETGKQANVNRLHIMQFQFLACI